MLKNPSVVTETYLKKKQEEEYETQQIVPPQESQDQLRYTYQKAMILKRGEVKIRLKFDFLNKGKHEIEDGQKVKQKSGRFLEEMLKKIPTQKEITTIVKDIKRDRQPDHILVSQNEEDLILERFGSLKNVNIAEINRTLKEYRK